MTEPQYTIAPMVWEQWGEQHFVATSMFGDIRLTYASGDGVYELYVAGRFVRAAGYPIEAAKAAAESWYRERLRPALREVEGRT